VAARSPDAAGLGPPAPDNGGPRPSRALPLIPDALFDRLDRHRLARARLARLRDEVDEHARALVEARSLYVVSGRVGSLATRAQRLVDRLGLHFDVPPKRVLLRDRPRPHRRRGRRVVYEVFGQCEPDGLLEVYTRTAVRAQPVALLTILDTLVHEWVHHYDVSRFEESVHCDGFFERVAQLYRPMRDVVRRLEA